MPRRNAKADGRELSWSEEENAGKFCFCSIFRGIKKTTEFAISNLGWLRQLRLHMWRTTSVVQFQHSSDNKHIATCAMYYKTFIDAISKPDPQQNPKHLSGFSAHRFCSAALKRKPNVVRIFISTIWRTEGNKRPAIFRLKYEISLDEFPVKNEEEKLIKCCGANSAAFKA